MATWRKKITLDHACSANTDQADFPFLIALEDPACKSLAAAALYFTLADGQTRIPHELQAYDPERGALQAWVRIPLLSSSTDTELYLYCAAAEQERHPSAVWDEHHKIVQHLGDSTDPDLQLPHSEALDIDTALTVQTWVHSDTYQAEAMQPLVSKWEPLATFDTFSSHDADGTDGLASRGFFGAVFDGQYVYGCPSRNESERTAVHGVVLRYNTLKDFRDPAAYEAYDAGHTDGLLTRGFYGGAFDGRYVYFNPRDDGTTHHSRFLRYDTHQNFKSSAAWEAYDASLAHSFQGLAFDGRYLYCCPGYTKEADMPFGDGQTSGKIMRFDTRANFKEATSYQTFDAQTLGSDVVCFDGAVFDGRYIYFIPLDKGIALQYDTRGDFGHAASWRTYDAGSSLGMGANVGAIFDGRHIYFASYSNSTMVRYDTRSDFAAAAAWDAYDATCTDGLDTGGFDGAFFDGRYVYYIPFTRQVGPGAEKSQFHGNYLRYDTRGDFHDSQSWTAHDAGQVDGLHTTAYNGGAFDGRYLYAAPWRGDRDDNLAHGRILRYDTLGENGSFSLRYCDCGHNGGLCAAVPGPSFIVNTTTGPLSIAAHQVLTPGWHHLAGVYSGKSIKLFVDGVLVGERSGSGPIQASAAAVSIGRIAGGAAHFKGVIHELRIAAVARSDDWIKTEYRNLANPAGYIRVGAAEQLG